MSKADELKKKLEKQAEKSCVLNDRIHADCFVSGYLKGALPREKRIIKLERENEELRNNGFTVSAMTEQQLKVALEKGEQLEKENAELKEKLNFKTRYVKGEKAIDQLAQATDLLKKMYYLYHDPCVTNKDLENREKLLVEVKQFIKEIEK